VTDAHRIATLSGRVRWVDGNRRRITRGAAVLVAIAGAVFAPSFFGASWSQFGAAGLLLVFIAIAAAIVTGFVVDLVLAVVTAKWETAAAQLAREGGLPRAVIRKKG
jgi:hypothetical protein